MFYQAEPNRTACRAGGVCSELCRSRRGGFSIVELLIVVGILAVVLGIMLPTVKGALEAANKIRSPLPEGQPGPDNTGPTGSLTPSLSIDAHDGQVIENLDITGSINAKGRNNVVIRNCRIRGVGPYGIRCDGATNIIIDRVEITGHSSAGVYGSGYTLTYSEIHHIGADATKAGDNCVIQGNWFHHLGTNDGAHADGVQIIGSDNIRIEGNFFDMPKGIPGTSSNAWLMIHEDGDDMPQNVVFIGNWCKGGNYGINGKSDKTTCYASKNIIYRGSTQYGCSQGAVTWKPDNLDTDGKRMGERDR